MIYSNLMTKRLYKFDIKHSPSIMLYERDGIQTIHVHVHVHVSVKLSIHVCNSSSSIVHSVV